MHSAKRNKRQSKQENYKFMLQWFRYALASKIQLMHVVDIRPVSRSVSDELPFAELVIQLPKLPLRGRISLRAVAAFLNSWRLQEVFLKWCGKEIARTIPTTSAPMKALRKSFANIAKGREGKLPPQLILISQYEKLVAELTVLYLKFDDLAQELTPRRRRAILEFRAKDACRMVSRGPGTQN